MAMTSTDEPNVRVMLGPTEWVRPDMPLERVQIDLLRGGPSPVRMSRFRLSPGAASPVDCHKDREIWMIAQGSGVLTYRGERTAAVQAGDILEFEPDASHTMTNTGGSDLLVFSIWWA